MQIDIVSDTVCPWCFIGKRRIERAMALRPDVKFDVVWRPYRLDPSIPREGVDRRAYLKAKFGDSPRTSAMGEAIRSEGESEGIAFAFDKIARSPNTLDSHRLIRWSANAGKQDQIVERLFQAYFIEGQDIGNSAVLSEVAAKAGMDGALVARLLAGDADLVSVEREAGLANEMGITGVPTFIFDSKFMISGAREAELLVRVIDKARTTEPAP
ncbi:MAG TPA: DsbA family oxidoreductase [Rhizomicrobium sp.]|jgi:predicted DsbA family dithiol-disulfide isomerase|nr:DsbA family oxidoreductase [Rhizomicrobium sp.]